MTITKDEDISMTTNYPQFPLDGFNEQQELLTVLNNDALALLTTVQETEDQGAIRAAIRAIFAIIEAKIWIMKQEYLGFFGKQCTPFELSYLTEQAEQLGDNGQLRPKPLMLPVKDNLRFAFAQWEKQCGDTHKVDFSKAGWQSFRDALAVRNRLTHPKSAQQMEVTRKDFENAADALQWFDHASGDVVKAAIFHLARQSGLTQEPYGPPPGL